MSPPHQSIYHDECVYLRVPPRLRVLGQVPQPRSDLPPKRTAKVFLLDSLMMEETKILVRSSDG